MRRLFIIATFICLIAGVGIHASKLYRGLSNGGSLVISQEEGNYYYDDQRDIKVAGLDIDGITYFFLPSYITDDAIEQISVNARILLPHRSMLETARYVEVQDILVDYGDGENIPWKMCFMKSNNLYSAFIYFDGGLDISDLTREDYIGGSMSVVDPSGVENYMDTGVEIKGRGNYSWQPDK